MIFPSGNRKNIDSYFNPLTDNPTSPYYEPELKKNVKKAKREQELREAEARVDDPRSMQYQAELKNGQPTKHDWAIAATAQKMNGNSNVLSRGCSIGSAQAGGLTNVGGTVRQMKTSTSNSIWDTEVLQRIKEGAVEFDKGDQIKADNKKLAEDRKALRKNNFLIDVDALKDFINGGGGVKSNSVSTSHAHASDASNYSTKVSSNQMSIFDKGDFDHVPDKTPGELIKDAAKARREKKDNSWERSVSAMSTKQKLNSFFENLRKSDGAK